MPCTLHHSLERTNQPTNGANNLSQTQCKQKTCNAKHNPHNKITKCDLPSCQFQREQKTMTTNICYWFKIADPQNPSTTIIEDVTLSHWKNEHIFKMFLSRCVSPRQGPKNWAISHQKPLFQKFCQFCQPWSHAFSSYRIFLDLSLSESQSTWS